MNNVKVGRKYRHFKGDIYKVIAVGYHSETQEKMVVYKDIETGKVCIRPHDMFISDVDHEKYPDVKQKKRFELIKNNRRSRSYPYCDYYDFLEEEDSDTDNESYQKGLLDGKSFLVDKETSNG